MRILQVVHYSSVGGVGNYTRDLFRALEAKGHQNVVIYDGADLDGLEMPNRPVYRLNGLAEQGQRRSREIAPQISEIVREARPDVVFVHIAFHLELGRLLTGLLPTVYFAHTYDAFCPSGALYYQRTDSVCELTGVPNWRCLTNAYLQKCNTRRPTRLWESYRRAQNTLEWTRLADAIVCDSAYVATRHVENGFRPERVHILPSPIPLPAESELRGWPREPIVLFAGRMTPHKGLAYLLQALTDVRAGFHLLIVGDGYGRPKLQVLAERLGLANRVSFLGPMPREELNDLYSGAAIVAVPSVWPEPFGMVGPEALSYGTPVVGFRSGGIPDWLRDGETGFLVEAKDSKGLAARIELLLNDSQLSQRLGRRGRELVEERFAINRHADDLLRLFEEAVNQRVALR